MNLLLALPHLFHDLLGCSGLIGWRDVRPDGWGRWLRLFLGLVIGRLIFVAGCRVCYGWSGRASGGAGAENDLPRGSLALLPDHHDVVAGAVEQLG